MGISESWVGSSQQIMSVDELTEPFVRSIKNRDAFRTGVELEYFIVKRSDFSLVNYEGSDGIRSILETFQTRYGWQPVFEKDRLIALKKGKEAITLEPSGAIEFVSAPQASISEANNSVMSFLSDLLSIIEPLGYAVPLLGYHPSHTPDTAPIMPKTRYDIMYSYMPKVGNRGREMMKLTSSLQVSVDFNSEKDALNKLNLANRAAPYFIAMSANSSVTQCEFAGVASARARAWTDTDPARCGFPKFIFNSGQTFSDYVEWALDVPMYFVERQDRKIDMTKYTFRQFLAGAINEIKDTELPFATRDDWETHLSTLFPWARLRHYVEIRAFDMNSPDINFELMLLIDRLFNNESILANLHNFLGPPDQARTEALLNAAINFGLDGEDLREGSKKILSLAMHASPTEDFVALSSRINSWKFDENKKEVERSYREYVNARLLKAPRPGL